MLFFFEPWNSTRPSSGLTQWIPSRLSARQTDREGSLPIPGQAAAR